MVKIRIPRVVQPPRATLEAEMNRLKQELEAEKSSNKQLRASIDVMQIGWDLDKQKLSETTANLEKYPDTNTNIKSEVPNITVQSREASGNVMRPEERLLTCSLCCKETFPNIEQFQKHLRTVGDNLMCPFCVRPKCICSLIKHLDKGCPRINKLPPLPYKFFAQQYFTKEAQTQTTESSITLPLQDIMAMVSVKMVQTLDKNGVERVLPHLIMEPYCKAKVNTHNTSGTDKPIQFGVPCVQKVPADSTGTHNLSPIHSNKDPLDNDIRNNWRKSGTENLNSNTSQTRSKQSLTKEHVECPSLDSENQNDMSNNKPDLFVSKAVKNREDKRIVKPMKKSILSGVFKSPDSKSASNNQSSPDKTNSKSSEKLVSILKSKKDQVKDGPDEKSLPEVKSIEEKKDKHIKKLSLSEIPNNQDENKDIYVEKPLLEVSISGNEKKNDKSFSKSSSSSRDNKKNDESVVKSSSFEVPKSADRKHSIHSEKMSLVEMKHQSSTVKTKSQSSENLVSLLKSKNDLSKPKTVLSSLKSQVDKKNVITPSTTISQNKKESIKDEIKLKNVRNGTKTKRTLHLINALNKVDIENGSNTGNIASGSNKVDNAGDSITGNIATGSKRGRSESASDLEGDGSGSTTSIIPIGSSKGDSTSGPNTKKSGSNTDVCKSTSNTESSASTSNTGGGGSDEFYCSACEVYFKSVVQHVDTYHPEEEVELEDEAYLEMPDDVKQRLVCKAETEVTEKVKQMLLNTPKNMVESVQTFSNSQNKSNKRYNSEKTPAKKKMKLYSDCCKSHMLEEKQMKVNKKVGKVSSFKCQDCNEMFNRKLDFEKHVCKSAIKKQKYTCFVCNEVLPFTKEIIDFHKKMHKEQGNGDTCTNKSRKSKRKELHPYRQKIVQQIESVPHVEKVQPVETVSKKSILINELNLVSYSKMPKCEVVLKDIGMKQLLLKRKCESELETPSEEEEEEVFKPKKPSTDGRKVDKVKAPPNNRKKDDKVKKISRKNSKVISDVKLSLVKDRKVVVGVDISSEDSKEDYKVKRPLTENNEVQSFSIDHIEDVKATTISTKKLIEQKIQLPTEDTESFEGNKFSPEVVEIIGCKVSDGPGSSGLQQERLHQSKQIVDNSNQKINLLRSDEKQRKNCMKQNLENTKEQTSRETIKTSLGKVSKKASTSSGRKKGAVRANSKVETETKSTLPTGAEDYWKSWREQLENDPEQWEKFLVEEQERFKNRQEKEKQHWLKTKVSSREAVKSQKLSETEKEEYKCKECEKRYQTAHALTVHIETIHMSQSQSEQATPKLEINEVFSHVKNSENINKCTLCLIEFTSLRQAEKHKLLHENEDAYHCQYCPCVYQLRVLLEEHVSNEHGKYQD